MDTGQAALPAAQKKFHFFRGIQKSFPTTRTTNKPFLRLRQRSLAVKNVMKERSILEYICIMSLFGSSKLFDFSSGTDNFYAQQVTKSSISITWNLTVKLRMSISLWGLPFAGVCSGPCNPSLWEASVWGCPGFSQWLFTIENLNQNKCSTLRVEHGRNGSARAAWVLAV